MMINFLKCLLKIYKEEKVLIKLAMLKTDYEEHKLIIMSFIKNNIQLKSVLKMEKVMAHE